MKKTTIVLILFGLLLAFSSHSVDGAANDHTDTIPDQRDRVVNPFSFRTIEFTGFIVNTEYGKLIMNDSVIHITGDTMSIIRQLIWSVSQPKIPTVLIQDGDTSRFYGGDTLRTQSSISNMFQHAF